MLKPHSILEFRSCIYQGVCMSPEAVLLGRLHSLIDVDFRRHKNANYYCGRLGYTVRCLNTVTIFHTCKTVHELIHDRMLVEAKELLIGSKLSAKCIAYELGFTRHDYFSRWFKKMTGYTAKNFRKEHAKIA